MIDAYSGLEAKTINSFKVHFCINHLPVRSPFSFYSTYKVLAAIIGFFGVAELLCLLYWEAPEDGPRALLFLCVYRCRTRHCLGYVPAYLQNYLHY